MNDLFSIKGKVAIITGACGVLGGSVAQSFVASGAKVVAIGTKQEKLDAKVKELSELGGDVIGFVGNVLDIPSLEKIAAEVVTKWGRIDILLNIAGGNIPGATLMPDQSFFEMLGEYILAGFKIAMIIAAMLIGFIAIISAINALFSSLFNISFQGVLGYLFYPLAFLIGIPAQDALQAGSIMATKLVANEFVAMIELKKVAAEMSPRGLGILSVFLVSFANFASIGIVAGAIKGLNERQGNVVSRFCLNLFYGSTLVSLLSAAVTGLILSL